MKITSYKISTMIILLTFAISICGQNSVSEESDSKKEAGRLWKLGIQAKGGRDRLHSIRSMQVSTTTKYYFGFKRIINRTEVLYVLPNKWWGWEDNRPSVFGLTMTMYNRDTGKKYVVQDGQNQVELEPIPLDEKSTNASGLLTDLMETKWCQPTIEKVLSGKVGKENVDIIQTSIVAQRVDFALSRKTHLPIRITAYLNNKPSYDVEFYDYVDEDGIKMPSRYKIKDERNEYQVFYQFNVEYNEDIFIHAPLPLETAAGAWKKK